MCAGRSGDQCKMLRDAEGKVGASRRWGRVVP